MHARRLVPVLAVASLSALSGCCSLARLFCGPDRTPWVSVDRSTARATLATFLEALRRDAPQVLYDCLTADLKADQGIDSLTLEVGYRRLLEQNPYLHLAGYVEIPERPLRERDGGVTYELDADGQKFRVALVRETRWAVRYRDAAGVQHESSGGFEGNTLNEHVTLQHDPVTDWDPDDAPISHADLGHALRFIHPSAYPLDVARIDFVGVGREWKIDRLELPDGAGS